MAVEAECFNENCGDEELNPVSHNKLLLAVSRIYNKQRVDKPKRSEPYLNVSEYNLSNHANSEEGSNQVEVFDLVNALDKKTSNQKIKSKFKSLETRSKKLPKPLEKIYSDQIKRSVGYEHVKKHVSRWNELVTNNRVAPQLSFPLKDESEVKTFQPLSFLSSFKEPTELEKNLAEALQQSGVAQKDAEVEEAIFKLSIPEMIKKRKFIAKMKAKESFQIVKAMKQNKIKSKKYRRIVRKEKIKQELKDFETLQRTDPEAALEKLNNLEKSRAEERASLRHRNTGKWARGQAIRAKYDVEARIQLAEQIAKSREITQKREVVEDSSSDEEGDEDDDNCVILKKGKSDDIDGMNSDDHNPWMREVRDNEKTVDEFIEGYQNYWKNKKNKPATEVSINKAALGRLIGQSINQGGNQDMSPLEKQEHLQSNRDFIKNPVGHITDSTDELPAENDIYTLSNNESGCDAEDAVDLSEENENINSSSEIKIKQKLISSSKTGTDKPTNVPIMKCYKKEKLPLKKIKQRVKKKQFIKNVSGLWNVEVAPKLSISVQHNQGKLAKTIDNLFDQIEDSVDNKILEKLKKIDYFSREEEKDNTETQMKEKAQINSRLSQRSNNETISLTNDDKDEELDDLLKIIEDTKDKRNLKDPIIDPNKFLNVKPRILNSQIPDMLVDGDDAIDDNENDRRAKISEAFADDNVVDQFRKEKEKEIKSTENKDIDLFLPGWGSWGGPNVNPKVIKRKRKRFIIKAPKQRRKDLAKPNVIISEDISAKYKQHLVSDIPFPFTSVRDYEASVRAPIGSTWMPESAVSKLTQPSVVKKMGTIIEPMNETQLAKKSRNSKLKVTNFNKDDGPDIK